MRRVSFLGLVVAAALAVGWARPVRRPSGGAAESADSRFPTFSVAGGRLRLEVCADDIVRVAFAKDDAFFTRPSLMAAPRKCTHAPWKLTKTDRKATITTAKLRVDVDLTTGAVAFFDAGGRPIAAERPGGRSLTPATVMGEATHHVRQQWQAYDGEGLYGLGQHQQGLVDIKGIDLELRQYNGEIFIPLLVSSRGYGVLWDNTSLTRFGRTEPPVWEEIPGAASGTVDWTRTFKASADGRYELRTYSSGNIQVDAEYGWWTSPALFLGPSAGPRPRDRRSSITGARAGFRARTSDTSA